MSWTVAQGVILTSAKKRKERKKQISEGRAESKRKEVKSGEEARGREGERKENVRQATTCDS